MYDDYISRESVRLQIYDVCAKACPSKLCKVAEWIEDGLNDIPAADVQPVKHGKWNEIYHDSENYSAICTYCQEPTVRRVWFKPYDFCPHCGAKMDLKEGDKNGLS